MLIETVADDLMITTAASVMICSCESYLPSVYGIVAVHAMLQLFLLLKRGFSNSLNYIAYGQKHALFYIILDQGP